MHIDIKKLADIIATHDLSQIERQLRFIGISVRQTHNIPQHTRLEKDQYIFKLAHAFITQFGKPNENWRASHLCFEQLYNWFENTTEIDRHDQLAILSWICQLNHLLSEKIFPHEMVGLGSAYYAEPYKFAAFLYWLIDNNVAPEAITHSNILQCYFAYHAFEISVIQNTYAWLTAISDTANHFVASLKNISCGMRGFVNNNQEDNTYHSYNVCGHLFSHPNHGIVFSPTTEPLVHFNLRSNNLNEIAETLFYLFDWELIKKLNMGNEVASQLLETLLQSNAKQKILSEFSSGALNGQFSKKFAGKIFFFISRALTMDALLALIESEPFYLHALWCLSSTHCVESCIKNSIVIFCAQAKYHTLPHLPFLVYLIQRIERMHHDENWGAEIQALLNMILGIILPYENGLHDNDIISIIPILQYLQPLLSQKIEGYKKNIDDAIVQFIRREIDFDAIAQVWSSQLSRSNLLFRLVPASAQTTLYPRTIYQLHALVLKMQYKYCVENNIAFPLSNLLLAFSPELAMQKRILQETLLDQGTCAELTETILDYSLSTHICAHIVLHSFGNSRSILFHTLTFHDQELQHILFRKILIPPYVFTVMETMIQENLIDQLNTIWNHLQLDVMARVNILKLFLNYFQNNDAVLETRNCYFEKIGFLLYYLKHTRINKNLLEITFQQGIKYGRGNLVKTLCMLDHPNRLSKAVIQKERIKAAVEHQAWHMVGLLCGLSWDPNFKTQLIQPNNVPLYFQLIKKYKKTHRLDSAAGALQYQNENDENLLHLAAKYCTFDQVKQFFREFRLALKPRELDQLLNAQSNMKQIPACTRSTPDAKEINDFLNEMRQTYSDLDDDTDDALHEDAVNDSSSRVLTQPAQRRDFTLFRRRSRTENDTESDEENNVPGPERPPLDEFDRLFRM